MIRRRPKLRRIGIDWSAIEEAGGIGKGPTIQLEKGWKDAAFTKALAEAYAIVDERDSNRSRITGIELAHDAADPKRRREHNHLGERSTHPDKVTDPSNIFLCSTYEHGFLTSHALEIEGTDANARLIFRWNRRMVPAGKEPFRLLSKRRSQNRTVAA